MTTTPRTDAARGFHDMDTAVDAEEMEKLEHELNAALEWRYTLQGWGGTPTIVDEFIKGQQARIYAAQDIEKELAAKEQELAEDRAIRQSVIDDLRQRLTARDATIAGLQEALVHTRAIIHSARDGRLSQQWQAERLDRAIATIDAGLAPVKCDTSSLRCCQECGAQLDEHDDVSLCAHCITKESDAARQSTGEQET